jgi:hypothetical protein
MFTVTWQESVRFWDPSFTVTKYFVVMTGETTGLCWFELNPGGTDVQE